MATTLSQWHGLQIDLSQSELCAVFAVSGPRSIDSQDLSQSEFGANYLVHGVLISKT